LDGYYLYFETYFHLKLYVLSVKTCTFKWEQNPNFETSELEALHRGGNLNLVAQEVDVQLS
jgi:hypothetical protein